ncbi:Protein phosphatase 2C 37 [Glycine soja]|nr:Protein phosphatase 2C 37 [Glycine soja]
MAGICCGVVGEGDTPAPLEPTTRPSRRRSLDILPLKYIADMAVPPSDGSRKRPKLDLRDRDNVVQNCDESTGHKVVKKEAKVEIHDNVSETKNVTVADASEVEDSPKFGVTSVCGRRRDMEDSVSVRPSFTQGFHYFGVFDGHGCSHVATMCKERLHEIVNEEIDSARENLEWKLTMENGFARMDDEVNRRSQSNQTFTCRCELQTPHCNAVRSTVVIVVAMLDVRSTAVVAIVTPDKLVVSNCGDSRAVLCRKGVAIPLSSDHKPDRPDELLRVQSKGGRVIYWDGPRVLGVLAMSRAIGDNYLKPYVISEPEVMVTERTEEDECLILASDGLWDVVSNETACGVVRMCLKADGSDRACSDASILLTKLALARHSSDNVSVVVVDLRRDQRQSSNSN